MNGLLISFLPAIQLLRDHPDGDRYLLWVAIAIYAAFAVQVIVLLRGVIRGGGGASRSKPAGNPIIVDGSNVMYWGGEPSLPVLSQVLRDLQAQGFTPIVFFDANVGYKLFDKYAKGSFMAAKLKLPPWQVTVVKGGVTADERLLKKASEEGLRVVTNDRFRDWVTQFPKATNPAVLVKGQWHENRVIWHGLDSVEQRAA